MNLVFRLIAVVLGALRRPRLGPLDESVVAFRVLPNDLDTNLHLNNGRFLTLMDLGRVDLMIRMGVVGEMRRRRWYPVIASAGIRFRRSLSPFQRFHIHTRLLCWDDRWFYMEQRFTARGETVASAVVKARFLAPGGARLAPQQVVDATPYSIPSPPMPAGVRAWTEAEDLLQEDNGRGIPERAA